MKVELTKFRIWDTVLSQFRYITLGDFCCNVKSPEFIVQQWSGVLDCKKDLIFEGDLVVLNLGVDPIPKGPFEIVFRSGSFHLKDSHENPHFDRVKPIPGLEQFNKSYDVYDPLCKYSWIVLEVVGNIFQNKIQNKSK